MSKTVVLCSSATFYKHVTEVANQLEKLGFNAVVPKTARIMAEKNDFDVEHYKTWYNNPDDYHKKAELMRTHFDEITDGGAILVVNDEKHGISGYIGPNVLMEMSLAWYQNKPIFVLNNLPTDTPFEEELKGFSPVVLGNNLSKIGLKPTI